MISKLSTALAILSCVGAVTAQEAAKTTSTPKIEDLGWITGCWERKDPAKQLRIVEQWMEPDGGAMLGMSRTVKDGKMTGYEFLRIVGDAGTIKYISRPSGNSSDTEFPVLSLTSNEVIFSNPQHDFPQRIIYRRDGDKLNARIEGTANGKTRGIDFPYTRAACN
jgi:hypothetical protein